jgi:hypothetical protein
MIEGTVFRLNVSTRFMLLYVVMGMDINMDYGSGLWNNK